MKKKLRFYLGWLGYCFMKLVHIIRYNTSKDYRKLIDSNYAKLMVVCGSVTKR